MSVFLLFFLHALRSGCVRACPWAGQATAVQCPARWSNRLAPSMLRCRPSNLWCGTCAVPSSFHSSSEPTPAETGICATTPRGCVMCRERQASVRVFGVSCSCTAAGSYSALVERSQSQASASKQTATPSKPKSPPIRTSLASRFQRLKISVQSWSPPPTRGSCWARASFM